MHCSRETASRYVDSGNRWTPPPFRRSPFGTRRKRRLRGFNRRSRVVKAPSDTFYYKRFHLTRTLRGAATLVLLGRVEAAHLTPATTKITSSRNTSFQRCLGAPPVNSGLPEAARRHYATSPPLFFFFFSNSCLQVFHSAPDLIIIIYLFFCMADSSLRARMDSPPPLPPSQPDELQQKGNLCNRGDRACTQASKRQRR